MQLEQSIYFQDAWNDAIGLNTIVDAFERDHEEIIYSPQLKNEEIILFN
jgi:hypothetical protein